MTDLSKLGGHALWALWLLTPDWRAGPIEAELRRRHAATQVGGLFEGQPSPALEELFRNGRRP